jgi:enoyl-[acyl-carrier protein] reductase III
MTNTTVKIFDSQNYWAVILGASGGMGLATAQKLAAAGMHLLLVYREPRNREAALHETFDALRQQGVQVHAFNENALTDEARNSLVQRFTTLIQPAGRIRLLLHSIAKGNLKKLHQPGQPVLGEEDFRLTIHAMATSMWQWTQSLYDAGLFAADARVIGLTSEGSARSWPGYAAVGAAKSVLENLARSMAIELAPLGIRTNIVQPGVTDTVAFRMIPGFEQIKEMALQKNPFGRLTTPQDIASIIYLLCTPEAAWINGALIHADGGEHCS